MSYAQPCCQGCDAHSWPKKHVPNQCFSMHSHAVQRYHSWPKQLKYGTGILKNKKGKEKLTLPVSISKRRIPTLHQSAALSWPLPWIISGDIYSTVPHIEFVLLFSSNSFANPKSVSIAWTNIMQKQNISQVISDENNSAIFSSQ